MVIVLFKKRARAGHCEPKNRESPVGSSDREARKSPSRAFLNNSITTNLGGISLGLN